MLENLRLTLFLEKQCGPRMFHTDHGLMEDTSRCVLEIYGSDLQGNGAPT